MHEQDISSHQDPDQNHVVYHRELRSSERAAARDEREQPRVDQRQAERDPTEGQLHRPVRWHEADDERQAERGQDVDVASRFLQRGAWRWRWRWRWRGET